MKINVQFEFNGGKKSLTINDFKETDIPRVEEYFYCPYARGNTFNKRDFYEYINDLQQGGKCNGYMKQSEFPPDMYITLEED